MPRDFVPCVYCEWEMYSDVLQTWQRRYEVIEVFEQSDRVTQEPLCSMSGSSHAYHVGYIQTPWVHANLSPEDSARLDQHQRARLFATFYAALAALE